MAGYNHYTPQSDGSYRRSTVPDSGKRPPPRPQQPQQKPPMPPPPPPPPPEPPRPEPCPPPAPAPPPAQNGESILAFLRKLLPRQIDAADLLVISLLLLMDREDGCEGMSPLLTIALYFLL